MKLRLETLAPVHIGSGAEIPPSEYWFDAKAGVVRRLNLERLVKDPAFLPHLERFVQEAAQGRQIDRYVPLEVLAPHTLYELPAWGEARGYLVQHPTVVKALVLSGGRAFIPGSSIKGSLLSAVLWHFLKREAEADPAFRSRLAQALTEKDKRESARQYAHLLGLTLGRFCNGQPNRFAKWLSVSDTNLIAPQGNLAVVLVEVVGARQGGQIPILMEALRPGVSLICELSVPAGACRGRTAALTPDEVLTIADSFYRRLWEKLEKVPPPSEGWLLRLGQGSGAWATSLLLLAEDLRLKYRVSPPVTRKLVDSRNSLGWVLLAPATGELPRPFPESQSLRPPGVSAILAETSLKPPKKPAAPAGPSPRLKELLERLTAVKPYDAGRVGAFLEGLKALEEPEEKAALAQAILAHFDRKMLKKNKRWGELEPYADKG